MIGRGRTDWLAHAVLVTGALLFAFPIWLVIAGSTQDPGLIDRGALSVIPDLGGLGVYGRVLAGPGSGAVWHMMLISFGMAMCITIGKLVLSVLSAYAVVFFRFPFRRTAFWTIFVTLMLPVEVRIVPTYAVTVDFGLIDRFGGLVLPLIASATATLLFRQVFAAIPDELVEAARMDGAGPWRFLRDMLLPVSAPNIAALFVILFVYGWNQYIWPVVVATSPSLNTIVVGIIALLHTEGQPVPWDQVLAMTTVALVPPVAVVILMQRWLVKGLTEVDK